jgi:hypothetical protein
MKEIQEGCHQVLSFEPGKEPKKGLTKIFLFEVSDLFWF